ncbi:MAG TPA: 30S ribosomal protein S4 [Candidatus Eisenbacteria bacterium]|jgi:small subunit ribosomal protein S4|nr:30S ribosomal protein S4 [Candidatus Eisenbacteria bacterium]
MATFHEGKCRQCRREGEKLFLKGTRCFTEKCAFERRGYAPGEHGKDRRPKETNYGTQLRMKQKARRIYGVLERQFRNYFEKAEHQKGVTGQNLLLMLERRLDNLTYRLGFAPSRSSARRLVRHRHMLVNGKLVDIPSYQVRVGDEISVKAASKDLVAIQASVEHTKGRDMMSWLSLDPEKLSGRLLEYPTRGNIPTKVSEQLIVELYSK